MTIARIAVNVVYVALWIVLGFTSMIIALDPGDPLVFAAAGVSFCGVMWLSARREV